MNKFKLMIADDNKEFCEIVKYYVQTQSDIEFVGVAYDGICALDMIEELRSVFADRFVLINENGSQEFTDFKAPKLAYEFLTGSDELTADEIFMITKVALLTRDAADKNVLLAID